MTSLSRLPLAGALALAGLLALARPAPAQSAADSLGTAPWAHLHTVLQKTILDIDVLTLDLCFDAETAARFGRIAARTPRTGARADSITRAALEGQRARGRVEFLRDISLADFIEGVGEDLRTAAAAGLLPDSVLRAITAGLPAWFAPLERRGIRKGDQLLYQLEPAAVHTLFVAKEGTRLVDRTERGRARRNSPLAAWLAPRSQFRKGLVESLQARARSGCALRPAR